jgi:hypothetical protein
MNKIKLTENEIRSLIQESIQEYFEENNINEGWLKNTAMAALGSASILGAMNAYDRTHNDGYNDHMQNKEQFIKSQVQYSDILDIVNKHKKLYGNKYNAQQIINSLFENDEPLLCMANANDELSIDRLKSIYMDNQKNSYLIQKDDTFYLIDLSKL